MPLPQPTSPTTICAIVCVRNELAYLEGLIDHLNDQGVDIAFIDNDSTDGSREAIESRLGGNVLSVRHLPYNGAFSLSDQLQAKAEVERSLSHEWIMHVDADEIHHPSADGVRLVDVARQAAAAGFNAVNFEEFVFLPDPNDDLSYKNAHLDMRSYYYFAPIFQRLVRMYRRGQGLDNRSMGGHRLKGHAIIYPEAQVLRHYIGLNQEHLVAKYLNRVFDASELKKGWHRNRVDLSEQMLSVDRFDRGMFEVLPSPTSRAFLRNRPRREHFWSWGNTEGAYNHLIQVEKVPVQKADTSGLAILDDMKAASDRIALLNKSVASLNAKLRRMQNRQKKKRLAFKSEIVVLRDKNQKAQSKIAQVQQSLSWRLTTPLRKIATLMRR